MLDVSVAFSYLLNIPVDYWYFVTIVMKMMIVLCTKCPGVHVMIKNLSFFIIFCIYFLVSILCSKYAADYAPQFAGFLFHLALTLMAIRMCEIRNYCNGIVCTGFIISILYLLCCFLGYIEVRYGRYMFFGDGHPNLGSEIIAVCIVLAGLIYQPRNFYIYCVPAITSIMMMQGRAALVASFMAIGLKFIPSVTNFFNNKSRVALLILLIVLIGALFLIYFSDIEFIVRALFLLDDEDRGDGTGFVGRGDRWDLALSLFQENPLLGVGLGYFSKADIDSPHNYYLYALSELGISSILLFVYLIGLIVKVYKNDRSIVIGLSPLLLLTIFNDRFIDLNAYPFVVYAVLLIASQMQNKSILLNENGYEI